MSSADLQQAFDEAQPSEESFRTIVDTIPALVWSARPDGSVDFLNRRWLDYTGLSAEEALGWGWTRAIHPDDRHRLVEYWRSILASGEPGEIEARMRRFDGEFRWFLFRGSPLRDATGTIVRWCGTNTDIDGRKRAEHDLRLTLDSIPALVNVLTAAGEIEFTNQPLLNYFGRTLEELRGWAGSDVIHPDDLSGVIAAWTQSVETGTPFDRQHRLRRADGAYRWFHGRVSPLRDGDGRIVRWYSVLTDIEDLKHAIDDRKNAEEALRQTQSRLSRAAQIATVAELSASIAHEVNQPLAAVVTNGHACLRWLSAQPPNLAKAVEAAERIIRDGKDAGEVVRRIRALFQRVEVERVALDVHEMIGEVLHLLERETARRGVTVETHFAKDLPPVIGDRVQLQQLVLNLLINGLEALDSVRDRPKTISVRSKRRSGSVALVEIADSGAGLPDPDRAFEAFFTTKENGMGMGLAICRSIVEEHNGELWAAAGQGPGTTFSFTLPLRQSVAS